MVLTISTNGDTDIVDITQQIAHAIELEKMTDGLVNIFVKGSTAAITTIETDSNLYEDLRKVLEEIIPMKRDWKHHETWGDDNGGAHLRAAIIGPSLGIPVTSGRLMLGTWQKIVLLDFDTSPRLREIIVSCLGH